MYARATSGGLERVFGVVEFVKMQRALRWFGLLDAVDLDDVGAGDFPDEGVIRATILAGRSQGECFDLRRVRRRRGVGARPRQRTGNCAVGGRGRVDQWLRG